MVEPAASVALDRRIIAVGDQGLLVELGDRIDDLLNDRVLALASSLRARSIDGIVEIVPTYRSLLIRFEPERLYRSALIDLVGRLLDDTATAAVWGREWQIPVIYGGEFGVDLDDLAAHHGLPADELIHRHRAPLYRVHMIGFQPGFAYLGGLDPGLARSRRTEPRVRTPAGSVSIGGVQAAVASVEAPSGWHLIGRTPVRLFMPSREPAFLLEAGDRVRFKPLPAAAWPELDRRAAAGELVAALAT